AQAHPWLRRPDLVQENPQQSIVVGNDEIDAAIIVEVTDGKASPDLGKRECASRSVSHIFEMSVAEIVQQLLCLMQRKGVMRPDLFFDYMDGAVGDDDIGPTVIVVIEERRAETCIGGGRDIKPGHGARVLELSASAVAG